LDLFIIKLHKNWLGAIFWHPFFICIYKKLIIMFQIKLDPQEIKFLIAATHNTQIYGRDAHVVSNLLKKLEEKINSLQEVKP